MSTAVVVNARVRTDFAAFLKKALEESNQNDKFIHNWHIDVMVEYLMRCMLGYCTRLIINVPPRSLKSFTCSVAWPAFVMGHDPGARFVCASYAMPLSLKLSRDFRTIVTADWYKKLFPDFELKKGTEDFIETTKGGARIATSVDGSLTGLGGEWLIIDDPMRPDEAPSEAARRKVADWYGTTASSRLNNAATGITIAVAQRVHEDDLSGYLLETGDWSHLSLSAIATEDEMYDLGAKGVIERKKGDLLHAARLPLRHLEGMRRLLGPGQFEAQYQQNPLPAQGNVIERQWLRFYDPGLDISQMVIRQSVDTAMVGDPRANPTVITTWGELQGKHYLLDVFSARLDFPALIRGVLDQARKYKPCALLIENKGSGISLIQTLSAGKYPHRSAGADSRQTYSSCCRISALCKW